ncbi:DMT family transporter [Geminicoccaceae bacterium 1502E]|nr:DMT family transporter [Geminicoccaceae bacterium 1502E]
MLLTLLAMGLFGTMDALSKALVTAYPAPLVLWLRHLAAVPIVLLILAPRRPLALARSRRPWLQLLRTAILVVEMGLALLAFRYMALAEVHSILAVTPLLATALSVPLLGERVGWRRWLAVAIGFLGVLVILRPGLAVIQPAALIALAATGLYAIYNVMTRHVGLIDRSETSFLWQIVGGALLLCLVGPFYWEPLEPVHWVMVVALAAAGAAGHYCLVRALGLAPIVVVQPFTYTLLVWAVVIGYLVFGNLPDLYTVAGAAMIVVAGSYAAWREHVRGARAARSSGENG